MANGAGTVGSSTVTNITVACTTLNQWAWWGGAQAAGSPGVYGTKGVASVANVPGARSRHVSWVDRAGNVWIFGGYGVDSQGHVGDLNDLWKFSPSANEWTWVGGSSTTAAAGVYGTKGQAGASNVPGARDSANAWTDSSGNFWLFGGEGEGTSSSGPLNDLWMYSPSAGEWTFVAGSQNPGDMGSRGTQGQPSLSNVPQSRLSAQAWQDTSGNLWIFSGDDPTAASGYSYSLPDLWEFVMAVKEWVYVDSYINETSAPVGRSGGVTWVDANGNFWLFSGYSAIPKTYWPYDGTQTQGANLPDLWEFDPNTLAWTLVKGVPVTNTTLLGALDNAGSFGTLRIPSSTNTPPPRSGAAGWVDSQGLLWMFGGNEVFINANQQLLGGATTNELWRFDPGTKLWTCIEGGVGLQYGIGMETSNPVYGTLGQAALGNTPGGKAAPTAVADRNGDVWLFGGGGTGVQSQLENELWKYAPVP